MKAQGRTGEGWGGGAEWWQETWGLGGEKAHGEQGEKTQNICHAISQGVKSQGY